MARIEGVDLPTDKRAEIALTYIYGIGNTTAQEILTKAEIDFDKRIKDFDEKEVTRVRSIINNDYKVEGALRGEEQRNIKRLKDIGCYRGIRHRKGLPVRGQKTQKNCRTRKGKRKTVANKKQVLQK